MNGNVRARAITLTDPRTTLLLAAVLTAVFVLAMTGTAHAVNAYGQTFAGQTTCLGCHGASSGRWQVDYTDTAHGRFITDIDADSGALVPAASKWPSPSLGGGYMFGTSDIRFMLGAPGIWHQYVTKYKNSGSHLLESGQTLNSISGPSDDFLMPSGIEWLTDHGVWENTAKVTARTYFQSCGGCHFLGVTRPTDVAYTLGSGASVDHSTETSYTGVGIQCEACHGTGIADATLETGHWTAGVRVVRTKATLDSQVCGQCHVNGTAKEKNFVGGTFSSPNGYTPDKKLTDFYNVSASQYVKTSPTAPDPVIPTNDTKVYPNGANKGMHHSYYNEWILTGHARSLRWPDGTLWTEFAEDECLPCHSGEGFLNSIEYGEEGPNDISIGGSSLATDELDIECGVCHTVHAKDGEPLGLRMNAEELCAKCHNSHIEEGESAEPGTVVHHPQREMIEGYGLIGVATPDDRFMDDTECPACHMPKTRETRVSHRFLPMLPGDAKEWNVQEFGDSCTPCHTSKSRDALQADLDEWAQDLDELAAEATAAIAAAQARGGAADAAGQLLIGSAQTNVSFVGADESHGAHNYPYAKAGLEKATYFARSVGAAYTRFGATSYSSSMKMAMLYGTLKMGDGEPAAGERATIQAKPRGTSQWKTIGTASVGDDGDFGFAVGPTGTTYYRAVWSPRSGVQVVSRMAAVNFYTSTSARTSASRIRKGQRTTISGAVSPNHKGGTATIYVKKGSGSFKKLTSRKLSSGSAYSYSWKPRTKGTYYVRTKFSGDSSHYGSTSTTKKVVVR